MKKEKIDDLREIDTRKRIKYETYNDNLEKIRSDCHEVWTLQG